MQWNWCPRVMENSGPEDFKIFVQSVPGNPLVCSQPSKAQSSKASGGVSVREIARSDYPAKTGGLMREQLFQEACFKGLNIKEQEALAAATVSQGKHVLRPCHRWENADTGAGDKTVENTRLLQCGNSDFEVREAVSLDPISRKTLCSAQHLCTRKKGFKGKWKLRIFKCMRQWIRQPQVRRYGWGCHPTAIF